MILTQSGKGVSIYTNQMNAPPDMATDISTPFEQGPIRPPSEAESLLVRLTRNCPWNRCSFCSSYKNSRFSLRTTEEIMRDIDKMRSIADRLTSFSRSAGESGLISDSVLGMIWNSVLFRDEYDRTMALWLNRGGESAFLQDADSLVMKTEDVSTVLRHLRQAFPSIRNITTYCRSHTAAGKSLQELRTLGEAGLTRIHIGLESGSDAVLKMIDKGATAAIHIEAGRKIKAAGLSLSEYVIPGLGGAELSVEHAHETARVLGEINPDFVRLRTMHVSRGTPLMKMVCQGTFIPLGDEAILSEIRDFISLLNGITSTIVSDHILNLLEEVQGVIPDDKGKMLKTLDRFFDLPERMRLVFRLGRRRGIYRRLDDLSDEGAFKILEDEVIRLEKQGRGTVDQQISSILNGYI
jgi:histone acetyltransferase (RNA polymerase elongator complex component)